MGSLGATKKSYHILAKITVICYALVVSVCALGAQKEISLTGMQKIKLSALNAKILLSGKKGTAIRLIGSEGDLDFLNIETADNELRIMQKKNLEGTGSIQIELQGPEVPIEIHQQAGSLSFNKWMGGAVLAHLLKGKIAIKDSTADFILNNHMGDVVIESVSGRVEIDAYKSNVQIKNHNGDLVVENFAGETLIERAKGAVKMSQALGNAKILGGGGSLIFEQTRGSMTTTNFSGRVEGVSGEGSISISMAQDSDINLKAQSGKVNVSIPQGVAVGLNLATESGDLFAPQNIRFAKIGGLKVVRTRTRGETSGGSVFVRSQEGSIFIK